ncbi:MAG: tetratricopeptide repeat protein [Sulfurifustis sp.]
MRACIYGIAPRGRRIDRFLSAFVVWLAATSALAAPSGVAPFDPRPLPGSLAPLHGEIDLIEAAFRDGVRFYEAGDYKAAVRTWQTPAEHGHVGAQFNLGVAYATGKGVEMSLERAVRWWRAAAEQGHTVAQLNLGLLYWRGEGVDKNLVEARRWWQQAAIGGDAAAQFHLGALAATGEGGPRNYEEAVRWWRLSAAQGYRQAIKGLEILKTYGAAPDDH